jgi:hypothetical protein
LTFQLQNEQTNRNLRFKFDSRRLGKPWGFFQRHEFNAQYQPISININRKNSRPRRFEPLKIIIIRIQPRNLLFSPSKCSNRNPTARKLNRQWRQMRYLSLRRKLSKQLNHNLWLLSRCNALTLLQEWVIIRSIRHFKRVLLLEMSLHSWQSIESKWRIMLCVQWLKRGFEKDEEWEVDPYNLCELDTWDILQEW